MGRKETIYCWMRLGHWWSPYHQRSPSPVWWDRQCSLGYSPENQLSPIPCLNDGKGSWETANWSTMYVCGATVGWRNWLQGGWAREGQGEGVGPWSNGVGGGEFRERWWAEGVQIGTVWAMRGVVGEDRMDGWKRREKTGRRRGTVEEWEG